MSKRTIEETFRAFTPKTRRGVADPPPIAVGVSGGGVPSAGGSGASGGAANSDLTTALSEAGQQIAQLQSTYQQQAALISANTAAIQSNTSAQGSHATTTAGSVASSFFGGALGFLSPVISGIASLFGGGAQPRRRLCLSMCRRPRSKSPVPFPAPFDGDDRSIRDAAFCPAACDNQPLSTMPGLAVPTPPAVANPARPATTNVQGSNGSNSAATTQVTVNISAMDSQSFMDRSTDIANAVREAMLNMHPINNVIANL